MYAGIPMIIRFIKNLLIIFKLDLFKPNTNENGISKAKVVPLLPKMVVRESLLEIPRNTLIMFQRTRAKKIIKGK
jgi:hypothetical protein